MKFSIYLESPRYWESFFLGTRKRELLQLAWRKGSMAGFITMIRDVTEMKYSQALWDLKWEFGSCQRLRVPWSPLQTFREAACEVAHLGLTCSKLLLIIGSLSFPTHLRQCPVLPKSPWASLPIFKLWAHWFDGWGFLKAIDHFSLCALSPN